MTSGALGGAARKRFAGEVEQRLLRGEHVVVCGPRGIGKTRLARWLLRTFRRREVPCALTEHTSALRDVTRALALAYDRTADGAGPQRRLKSLLRAAAERTPGVLLLDHVEAVPLALRGYLRSLRGGLAGVAYFVDVDVAREHARLRGWHLGHAELVVPPLGSRAISALAALGKPRLDARAVTYLTRASRGRPGFFLRCLGLITRGEYWAGTTLCCAVLAADVEIALRCPDFIDPLTCNFERTTS